MKKLLVTSCCAFFLMSLTGCWDRREINDVGFVIVSGLDVGEKPDTYRSTLRVAIPKKMGGGQTRTSEGQEGPPFLTLFAESKNLDQNRIILEQQMSRELSTSHRRMIVLGEPLAKRGLKEVMDEFSRNPQNRLRTFLVITKGMDTEGFLKYSYPLEPYPTEALREMLKRIQHIPTTLRDIFIQSTLPGREPIIAAASISPGPYPRFMLNHIAILRDYKLVGYLEGTETMLLNTILKEQSLGILKIRVPGDPGHIAIQITECKVKGKVKKAGEKLDFSYTVKANGRITESTTSLDLSNPKYIDQIDQLFTKELKKRYIQLFDKLQRTFKADSAGLGNMVYQHYPAYWKQIEKKWPQMYPKQKITWHVQAAVNEIGVSGAPLILPESEVKK